VILGAVVIVAGASMFFVRRITEIISQSTKGVEKGVQRNFRKHRIKILLLACVLIAIMVGAVYLQYRNSTIDQTNRKSIYTNSQFVVPARDSQGCHVQHGVFQASDNQTFHGSVKSSQPIDFLILSENDYEARVGINCNPGLYLLPTHGVPLYQTDVTQYEFNWPADHGGTYYFVFLNRGLVDASVTFNAYAYQQYRAEPTTKIASSTSELTLNDLLVLKTKYPNLFNPNNTYIEFASIDLSTNPKVDGTVTFRDVTVTHSYVSGMLVPNGVQLTLTRGLPGVVVFALADYGSQVPTSASLTNSVNTFLVTPESGVYPHVYLFLVS
jgi:hypothetical protein